MNGADLVDCDAAAADGDGDGEDPTSSGVRSGVRVVSDFDTLVLNKTIDMADAARGDANADGDIHMQDSEQDHPDAHHAHAHVHVHADDNLYKSQAAIVRDFEKRRDVEGIRKNRKLAPAR